MPFVPITAAGQRRSHTGFPFNRTLPRPAPAQTSWYRRQRQCGRPGRLQAVPEKVQEEVRDDGR